VPLKHLIYLFPKPASRQSRSARSMNPQSISIEYPSQFPIKIMGATRAGFAQAILEVIQRHAPDFDAATMGMKTSRQGKYLSITCEINATSRAQLDALYQELCDHPMVVMVL
jgi:putative lipoic acid-binding regulatory protein